MDLFVDLKYEEKTEDNVKELKDAVTQQRSFKSLWNGKGVTSGYPQSSWPGFREGQVIGVEIDMDAGTVGYWADGEFLGLLRDNRDKLVNIKGKKVVPAVSLYGRTLAAGWHGSKIELRTGLEAPERPAKKEPFIPQFESLIKPVEIEVPE